MRSGGCPHFHRHSRQTIKNECVGWTFHISTSNCSNMQLKFMVTGKTPCFHNIFSYELSNCLRVTSCQISTDFIHDSIYRILRTWPTIQCSGGVRWTYNIFVGKFECVSSDFPHSECVHFPHFHRHFEDRAYLIRGMYGLSKFSITIF